MKMNTRYALFFLPLALAACGGSGGGDSQPPATGGTVTLEVIAGPVDEKPEMASNTAAGCADGPFSAILLGSQASLAVGTNGQALYTAERGACDGVFRIRKFDLASKMVATLAAGRGIPSEDESGPFQLQTFLTPTAITQTPDGTLVIADSEIFTGGLTLNARNKVGLGNGVWALSTSGQLTQLAGFDRPARTPMADGISSGAAFESITSICSDAKGDIYLSDLGRVRKLTLDGKVTTLANADGKNFEGLFCGQEGRNLTASPGTDGQRKAYELRAQRLFNTSLGSGSAYHGLAMNGAESAWVMASNGESFSVMELTDGSVSLGSTVNATSGVRVGTARYTVSLSALRGAGDGVAYLPSAFSVIRVTYK